MPDPLDTNDDWADLAREFNLDKPAPQPADRVEREIAAERVEPHHGDPRAEESAAAEGEPEVAADEDLDDDADDAAPAEPGEPTAEGEQPGTKRKRKRRRRRRKGPPVEGAVSAAALEEAEAEADPDTEADESGEVEVEAEPVAEATADDDFTSDADEAAPLAAEEDTASEVLRDLIANWNVPSWDEIIGGLYRPG
ncbi:MAG: hypothetical protein FJ304_15025 [Planctomycetes bacterium]|nr:hypothetical protein [Planctomycetota bacterium]